MDSPDCPKSAVGQDGQVGQWIPVDSPDCPKSAVGQDGQVGQWIPMDSPDCPKSAVGQDGQVGQWIPMDSPNCPKSAVGQDGQVGYGGPGGTVDSNGQSHVSNMVQWGGPRWDCGFQWSVPPVQHGTVGWAQVGLWIPMVSPTCPTWTSGVGPGGTVDSNGQSHLSYV